MHPSLRHPLDGRNLLSPRWTRPFSFHEQWHVRTLANGEGWQPSWRSIRTTNYQYVEWYTDGMSKVTFREYYDLNTDPGETNNLLADADPSNDPNVKALHAQLLAEASCSGISGPSSCA